MNHPLGALKLVSVGSEPNCKLFEATYIGHCARTGLEAEGRAHFLGLGEESSLDRYVSSRESSDSKE